jgi:hypothetical protein
MRHTRRVAFVRCEVCRVDVQADGITGLAYEHLRLPPGVLFATERDGEPCPGGTVVRRVVPAPKLQEQPQGGGAKASTPMQVTAPEPRDPGDSQPSTDVESSETRISARNHPRNQPPPPLKSSDSSRPMSMSGDPAPSRSHRCLHCRARTALLGPGWVVENHKIPGTNASCPAGGMTRAEWAEGKRRGVAVRIVRGGLPGLGRHR